MPAEALAEVVRRQAARQYGAGTAERRAGKLTGIADPEHTAEVGEWLIECENGGDLLERVERLGAAPVAGSFGAIRKRWPSIAVIPARAGIHRSRGGRGASIQAEVLAEVVRRQAARKYGAGTAERRAGKLAGIADPEHTAEVGEWLIECEDGGELLDQVERLGAAPVAGGDPLRR